MNIRSLKGRLRRVESKMKVSYLAAYERSLSPAEREALYQASLKSCLAGEILSCEPVAIETLMEELGLDEVDAIDLWQRYEAAQASEPTDPELERMSDEELVEYIERSRQEIRELVAGELVA